MKMKFGARSPTDKQTNIDLRKEIYEVNI